MRQIRASPIVVGLIALLVVGASPALASFDVTVSLTSSVDNGAGTWTYYYDVIQANSPQDDPVREVFLLFPNSLYVSSSGTTTAGAAANGYGATTAAGTGSSTVLGEYCYWTIGITDQRKAKAYNGTVTQLTLVGSGPPGTIKWRTQDLGASNSGTTTGPTPEPCVLLLLGCAAPLGFACRRRRSG